MSDPDAYSEFMLGLRDSYSDRRERIESAADHLSKTIELHYELFNVMRVE